MGQVIQAEATRSPFGELKPLAAAMGLGLSIGFASPATAGTITVNNLSGGSVVGQCTLRDAVQAANTDAVVNGCAAGSGTDIINFSVNGTITLANEINITSDLTVNGPGLSSLTISPGAGTNRVFHISGSPTVTISGVTIQRSSGQTSGNGGAIYNYGGTLTIQNSTLTGNQTAFPAVGGAIASAYGTVTINNSTLSNNTSSDRGGAIYMYYGAVNITNNSTLTGNTAGASESGGGVFIHGGTLTIANSTLSGNMAGSGGGGIFANGFYYYLGVPVRGQRAQARQKAKASQTGPLSSKAHKAHAHARFIQAPGKHAQAKRAHAKAALAQQKLVHAAHRSKPATVTPSYYTNVSINISNSTFSGNQAGTSTYYDGGALYARFADVTINNSTFSSNSAKDDGGAIYHGTGALNINSSTLSGNQAGFGGAISRHNYAYYYNSTDITNSTFSGNATTSIVGGAGALFAGQLVTISNSTFSGNTAAGGEGGALNMFNGTVNLVSTIMANSTDTTGTRDIMRNGGTLNATNSLIFNSGGFINGTNTNNILGQNPLLGPLANNGGPTLTHALLTGSPAIDKGSNPLNLTFDQRGAGFPRTLGAQTDIGAFEGQAAAPAPIVVPTLSQWGTAILSAMLAAWAFITGFGRRRRREGS